MSELEGFQKLFQGRTDAWGAVTGMSTKEPVTSAHYQRHLEGKVSLGIYPLLDNGTCHFLVFDLDEKVWAKAIAIRDGLASAGIEAYISLSKSKGYHIWVFCEEGKPFIAQDVRTLALGVMDHLKIALEVFPKQDKLDKMVPLGNYINLPCFGVLSKLGNRFFVDNDQKEIPLAVFLTSVKRTSNAQVIAAHPNFPIVVPQLVPVTTKGKKLGKKTGKHPPCIENIMGGVVKGARDVAAFALARHYFDQGYLPAEILGLFLMWDKNNQPPLGMKDLEIKIKSAERGYAFGCSSVTGEPLLASNCIGENNCQWLKDSIKDRKKAGLIQERSFYENDGYIFEEIWDGSKPVFLSYNKKTGETTRVPEVNLGEISILPIYSPEITERAVTLPSAVEEYGDTNNLHDEVMSLIHDYVDIRSLEEELCAWYIIGSWAYDRLPTLSYLRFIGDTGTGKSRSLDVIGRLCYKPMMMAGAVTPAPIYRLIQRFRGTLILEEADFRESTEKSEVVTILNCGFELNRPVIRCSQDNPDNLQILPCFGPKVFATRYKFEDIALEARCITFTLEETDRINIPPLLGKTFSERAQRIRNKLLLWRFRNLAAIDPGDVESINLDLPGYHLEPRLKQIGMPFAMPFRAMPEVMDKFRLFMRNYQEELTKARSDSSNGRVVGALFKLAQAHGVKYISSKMIAEDLNEEFKMEMTSTKVGKILGSLRIKTTNRRAPGGRARYLEWDWRLMQKLLRKYIADQEDFKDLFESVEAQASGELPLIGLDLDI